MKLHFWNQQLLAKQTHMPWQPSFAVGVTLTHVFVSSPFTNTRALWYVNSHQILILSLVFIFPTQWYDDNTFHIGKKKCLDKILFLLTLIKITETRKQSVNKLRHCLSMPFTICPVNIHSDLNYSKKSSGSFLLWLVN